MDALTLLKQDHKKVAALLKQLANTTERAKATRNKLFEQIKSELELHTKLEETLFYPVLKEYKQTRGLAFEAYEEHGVVDFLLDQLSKESSNTENWTAKFKVLKETIEHHVKEEEGELFPKVKKNLPKEELKEIGNEILLFKAEA